MILALCGAGIASLAFAAEPEICGTPEYLTHVEGKLTRVAKAARKEHRLDILVLGTGSSALASQAGSSYPARLQASLAERLPGTAVTVRTDVKSSRTAAEMEGGLNKILLDAKPDLLVWQTGTVDAIKGVDPDEFRATLDKGVARLRAARTDVVLINMQYSPRTESMISLGPFVESMRWVAQQNEVPLFDRFGVMRHWNENATFDLSGPDRARMAERVHDCIGKLIAELIIDTAHLNRPEERESR